MSNKNLVEFDRQKLSNLKRAYTNALKDKKEVFKFEGNDLLVSFAKYLIEYLDSKLAK